MTKRTDSDRLLFEAARGVGLLAAVTPLNAAEEHARLESSFCAGEPCLPRWTYGPPAPRRVHEALGAARSYWAEVSEDEEPLAPLHRARCEELDLELSLVAARGSPSFGDLARERFRATAGGDALAKELAKAELPAVVDESCSSDGLGAESLVQRLRALVGELKLPFRVEVHRDLVPLAATGDGVILVAAGRKLTTDAAMRTALHEVRGHAVPRARAAERALRLFGIGTSGGVDDQEGYALVLEERAGYLAGMRARELALRHELVTAMRAGADFVEGVRMLEEGHGCALPFALRLAERIFRGGDGRAAGLGREAVYLSALERVRAHLARYPDDESVLASGQVSVDAAPSLRAHANVPLTRA